MPKKGSYLATHILQLSSPVPYDSLSISTWNFLQQVGTESSSISCPSTLYNSSTGKHRELLSWQVPELWLSLLTFGFQNRMILLHRIPTNFFLSWSPGEENAVWVDQTLLVCCTFIILHYFEFMLVFRMVVLNMNCNSRFIGREWVTHHRNATSLFSGVWVFGWLVCFVLGVGHVLSHIIEGKE